MGKLSNDIVREKTMRDFLVKTKLDLSDVEIHSIEGLYAFSFTGKKNSINFAHRLKASLDPEIKVKSIKLDDLIDAEFAKAICSDPNTTLAESHRLSCRGVWGVVKSKIGFCFSSESGMLEISLPNPAYAPLLNLLTYPHLNFTAEGKLLLDINALIKDTPEGIVKIHGGEQQLPLILLNPKALESKKIFYTTETLANNQVAVTPHFFVPQQVEPPKYHFALDVSESMQKDLPNLKKSVCELAVLLFDYQPKASLSLTIFSNGIHDKGLFTKSTLQNFKDAVECITFMGNTPLNLVTADFLEKISTKRDQNNILLFTDGEDCGSPDEALPRAKRLISSLQNETTTLARSKFYVFAYRVAANYLDLMQQVADLFKSELIDTASADFLSTQNDPESMKKWAAPRDLFKSRVEITNASGMQAEAYSKALDLSGQLVPLNATVCRPGDQVSITVTNGDDHVVASGTQKAPHITVSNAQAISQLGIRAGNSGVNVSTIPDSFTPK